MKKEESKFLKRLLMIWGVINALSSIMIAAAYSANNVNDLLAYMYFGSVFIFAYMAILLAIRLSSKKQLQYEETRELARRYNYARNAFDTQISEKITRKVVDIIISDIANPEKGKETSNHTFTIHEIDQLQSEIHKITGDGEVMKIFNKLLGVNAG